MLEAIRNIKECENKYYEYCQVEFKDKNLKNKLNSKENKYDYYFDKVKSENNLIKDDYNQKFNILLKNADMD
jgi:hypothetical protein